MRTPVYSKRKVTCTENEIEAEAVMIPHRDKLQKLTPISTMKYGREEHPLKQYDS